jgi:uncharacterized protein YlxW (UPF0749 family)
MSNDDEIERLKKEKAAADRRTAQAVKAEKERWAPALKEAQNDLRYTQMKLNEEKAARRKAEEKLEQFERNSRPGQDYKSGLSGPR